MRRKNRKSLPKILLFSALIYLFPLISCSKPPTSKENRSPLPPLKTATPSSATSGSSGIATSYVASTFADLNQITFVGAAITGDIKGLSVSHTGKVYASLDTEGVIFVFNQNYDYTQPSTNSSSLLLCDPAATGCDVSTPYPTLTPGMLDLINQRDPSASTPFVFVSNDNTIYKYATSAQVFIKVNSVGYQDGDLSIAKFKNPNAVRANKSGTHYYISDIYNKVIRRIDIPTNSMSTYAGFFNNQGYSEGGVGTGALNGTRDLILDSNENLYIADSQNNRIRKVSYTTSIGGGILSTFAGNGNSSIAEGIGMAASVGTPESLSIDNDENLYVTDSMSSDIMAISLSNQQVKKLNIVDPNHVFGTNNYNCKIAVDTSLTPHVIYISNYNQKSVIKLTPQ